MEPRVAAVAAVAAALALLIQAVALVAALVQPPPALLAGGHAERAAWAYAKAPSWWDTTVPNLSDADFRSNFRVCPDTFEYIVGEVAGAVQAADTRWRKALPAQKVVAIALYRLATGHDYRSIGNLFGVSTSVTQSCVVNVVEALASHEVAGRHIKMPVGWDELEATALGFQNLMKDNAGMPGIVSAVDGTHIKARQMDPGSRRSGFDPSLPLHRCATRTRSRDTRTGATGRGLCRITSWARWTPPHGSKTEAALCPRRSSSAPPWSGRTVGAGSATWPQPV